MSRLIVNQIQGDAVSKQVEIPTGHKLKSSEAGAIVHPGSIVQHQVKFLGHNGALTDDPTTGNHTDVTTGGGVGASMDTDGYWADHVLSFTTQTPTATFFQLDITPVYSNSIMRIEHNPHVYRSTATDTLSVRIVRTISGGTATVVYQPQGNNSGQYGLWYGMNAGSYLQPTIVAYDKPATTTSTNYRIYVHTYGGNTNFYGGHQGANQWAPKQYLSVTEIAQ